MKTKEISKKSFNNWKHNSIRLTFPNGNKLSTIWGNSTYSDNHDRPDLEIGGDYLKAYTTFMDSDTCECMILNAPDKLVKKIHRKFDCEGDTVLPYLTMTQWLELVKLLSK